MRYHIVGIAGSGMSAIAHLLLDQGHTVSGSDLQANRLTAGLAARGAEIALGHRAENISGAEAVLTTSAAAADHVELLAARTAGLPLLKRADLWREWSTKRDIVAVAGTHGKTTTTAMLALALERAGLDPGYLIGAEVPDLAAVARWGSGPLVIEADEYDRTFLALTPQIAVVTNVDWDHVDCYPDPASYTAAFAQFMRQAQAVVIGCIDDPGVQALRNEASFFQGYGAAHSADWRLIEELDDEGEPNWTLASPLGHAAPLQLALPGQHNRLNAAGAALACSFLGLDPGGALALIASYRGAGRRFELKGEARGITVVDDYAHHPREVLATLAAARERFSRRRIAVYFQPHTYSRTARFLDDWAVAFGDADLVFVGNIYGARETMGGVDAATLAGRIVGPPAQAVGDLEQATAALLATLQPGDVLLTLSAGDGWKVGEQVLEKL